MSVKVVLLSTRPINPQQGVRRHFFQSASEPISLTPLSLNFKTGCRGQCGNKEGLALKNIPCVKVHITSARESSSFILHHFRPPSFSLSLSLSEEKENRREERRSLSLRPACLAVFKWCTGTGFCLPRQIHCGSRWANTHTHILT